MVRSKTSELSLELFQSILGGLGRPATHDRSSHVRLLLPQDPLSFGKRPVLVESSFIEGSGHGSKMRRNS
jgi:hypothetical protein